MMTVWGRTLVAGAGSAALLGGALAFQYIGGLAPCPMCIWQRWPHAIAILVAVLGVTVFWRHTRLLSIAGALAMLASAWIGLYHTGVERGWWEGPSTCTSGDIGGLSTDALLNQILAAPLVRCDEVVWEFLSLSMASWNALISLILAGMWIASAVRVPNPYQPDR